jgi:DNA-binding IclR family transcriptional regulator
VTAGVADGAARLDMGSVIGKLDAILDALSDESHALRLTELARRTGLPKSTVYRLCRILTTRRILERDERGYQLGVRLFELGERAPRRRNLCDLARPHLEDLTSRTRAIADLAILDGLDALVIEQLAPPASRRRHTEVGARLPLYCTAAGRALLAFGPGGMVGQVVSGGMRPRTPRSVTSPAALARALVRTHQLGAAVEVEEFALGFVSVAAPVLDHGRRVVAAVSATLPSHAADMELMPRRVIAAAEAIAAQLISAREGR